MADEILRGEDVVPKKLHLLVGDGEAPLRPGLEFDVVATRRAPLQGAREMEGVVGEPQSPVPEGLGGRQIFVMPRYDGDTLSDMLKGRHLTVNILVYDRDEKLVSGGTGTLWIAKDIGQTR